LDTQSSAKNRKPITRPLQIPQGCGHNPDTPQSVLS
jgi:hypothetical protein